MVLGQKFTEILWESDPPIEVNIEVQEEGEDEEEDEEEAGLNLVSIIK